MTKEVYKKIENDGITAVVVNKGKILLLKRRNIPFITHPGMWYFISGGKNNEESHIETAYREIKEETGIPKEDLRLLYKEKNVIFQDHKKHIRWENNFYIFSSKNTKIKLNLEHGSYKWITFEEFEKHHGAISSTYAQNKVLKLIKRHLAKS